jgi:hypothetical protein
MYDLSLKETFVRVIEERGDKRSILIHTFRTPTSDDWYNYFRLSSQVGLSKGRDTVEFTGENQDKDAEFWGTLIQRVEGYKMNGVDVLSLPDWKNIIPLPHKLQAFAGLLWFYKIGNTIDGSFEETNELDLGVSSVDVRFEAAQNGQASVITFTFKQPEPTDYLKYGRITARMQLVRTKQRGVSAIKVPATINPMVELFDKLIDKVDGYSYEGKPLMELPEWRSRIDLYHKREAIRELFGTTTQEEEEKNG